MPFTTVVEFKKIASLVDSLTVPVGSGGIYCNGQIYAGFATHKEADAALTMYMTNPSEKDGRSKHKWEIRF